MKPARSARSTRNTQSSSGQTAQMSSPESKAIQKTQRPCQSILTTFSQSSQRQRYKRGISVYQICAIFWTNNQLHLSPVTFTPLAIFSSFEWISVDCPYGRLWPFTSVRCRIDTVPVSAPCRCLRCRWPVVSLCVNPLCPLLNLILLRQYILISHVVDSCFLVQVASWQFARCSSMAPFHLSKDLTLTRFRIFRRQPFTPASSNTMQGYTQRIGCHMSQNRQPSN